MTSAFCDKDFKSNDGMLTSVWGPSMWHSLHTISFNYPVKPTQQQQNKYYRFFMSLTDPIGDMIARIKNAQLRNHRIIKLPSSNFKVKILNNQNIKKIEKVNKNFLVTSNNKKYV